MRRFESCRPSHPVRALSCGFRHVRNLAGFPGVIGPALNLETANSGWWRRSWRAGLRLSKMRFGLVLGGGDPIPRPRSEGSNHGALIVPESLVLSSY